MHRRWPVIAAAAVVGLVAVAGLLTVTVFYGRIGAWAVERRALPRVAARLGQPLEVGAIEVSHGRAVLKDVVVRQPGDGDQPLIRVPSIEVDFAFWPSLVGRVELGEMRIVEPHVVVRLTREGDNLRALLDRMREPAEPTQAGKSGSGARPTAVVVEGGHIELRDEKDGVTLTADGAAARIAPGAPATASIASLEVVSVLGPRANLEAIELSASLDDPLATATLAVGGGRVDLWRGMSLGGVRGTIARGQRAGVFAIDLTGGYAGVDGTLWRAKGWVDPRALTGDLELEADRFTFGRIAPVLEGSPVVDFDDTSLDARFHVVLDDEQTTVSGEFELSGLNLFHPGLAEETIRGLGGKGSLAARYDRGRHLFELEAARLATGGVEYVLSGRLERTGDRSPGDRLLFNCRLVARLQIPEVTCQAMLGSIPPAFVPHLQGFRLRGRFSTDVSLDVDWNHLDDARLDGSIGIRGCKVVGAPPEMDPRRLEQTFEHQVEVEKDVWQTIQIGPESPDFVPLPEVSLHLVNSLMTTEDSGFYNHHGFIVREFRTALIKDLEAGYFKYGASSITMQMVKNVLLSRQKTLGRKVQELFLTWYVEQVLSKERILEIYLNAIEYGPGLYGIKPAAALYFGKLPRDLTPTEAAFFSSILPAPKKRYVQFCKDKVSAWTANKIQRILQLMVERQRLGIAELEVALATPLLFQPNKQDFCTRTWSDEPP